jgi:hypothetical protein
MSDLPSRPNEKPEISSKTASNSLVSYARIELFKQNFCSRLTTNQERNDKNEVL